jgi:outer membrane protein W
MGVLKINLGVKMKLQYLVPGIVSFLLFSGGAIAEGYYVKPYAGLSYMNDVSTTRAAESVSVELEQGMVLGAAFGYRYNADFAVELAWEYRSNESETQLGTTFYPEGNYASNIFFLNGIYFFNSWQEITPYVGFGLGWMQEIDIDLELAGVESSYSSSGNFTYQGFVGLEYPIAQRWVLHTELRHAGGKSGDLKSEAGADVLANLNYKPFTWQLGVKYLF